MNLEQFPTSETAKKMLSYITGNGFYDNSYVGKWIFQVMGEEMGDARAIIDELPLQAFVETATWGLRYHEEKYGLPIRENLSPDERRKIILEKRDLKAPMSPWRMEKIISGILGCTVDVVDINEPGSKISHPNMFIVYLEGEGEFSLGKAVEKLDEVKQSHTFYELRVRIAKFILDEKFFWKNIIRTNFTWWDACLDGRELLDGSILLAVIALPADHTAETKEEPEIETSPKPLVINIPKEQFGKIIIYLDEEVLYEYEGPIKVERSAGEYKVEVHTGTCSCFDDNDNNTTEW